MQEKLFLCDTYSETRKPLADWFANFGGKYGATKSRSGYHMSACHSLHCLCFDVADKPRNDRVAQGRQ